MNSNDSISLKINDLTDAVTSSLDADHLSVDPDNVARDLSQLVLSLVEFLRQLMEAQAIRRMEAGTLTEEEEERLGTALMKAKEQIVSLADEFGLSESDLRLDLGPLGRVV